MFMYLRLNKLYINIQVYTRTFDGLLFISWRPNATKPQLWNFINMMRKIYIHKCHESKNSETSVSRVSHYVSVIMHNGILQITFYTRSILHRPILPE